MLDIAIIGAGPAGLAAAIALARRGRTVTVLERDAAFRTKGGETFGPRLRPLLEQLGAWGAFTALATVGFRGVRSAWGTASLHDRPSVLDPFGEGWHVDRARFEQMLARLAIESGAEVRLGAGACSGEYTERGIRVGAIEARILLDASGRGAPASARMFPARKWISLDRQVGVVVRAPLKGEVEPELLLESCEEGWWCSAPQPDGTLVCTLLTDADLLDRNGLEAAFARTIHTRARAGEPDFGNAAIVRADAGFLTHTRAPRFHAIGDAAMAGDPLAGDGVERALRSALEAAEAVDEELAGGENRQRPRAPIEGYLATRASYYGLERRWPDALYWRRRLPVDVSRAPIVLSPVARLQRGEVPASAHAVARVEALVPRRAITAALDSCEVPRAAHAVLGAMRFEAPLADLRLLVALQELVAAGVLAQAA